MSVRTNITLRCRLSGDPKDYQLLNEMAGANRYTYNNALNHLFKQYQESINDTQKMENAITLIKIWGNGIPNIKRILRLGCLVIHQLKLN